MFSLQRDPNSSNVLTVDFGWREVKGAIIWFADVNSNSATSVARNMGLATVSSPITMTMTLIICQIRQIYRIIRDIFLIKIASKKCRSTNLKSNQTLKKRGFRRNDLRNILKYRLIIKVRFPICGDSYYCSCQ